MRKIKKCRFFFFFVPETISHWEKNEFTPVCLCHIPSVIYVLITTTRQELSITKEVLFIHSCICLFILESNLPEQVSNSIQTLLY
uniref:Uncharacterized protein n=1 Tax=Octopus bimaculoides TaxID=37653 RepID=A0A0L8FWC6_OCTBM